jgi:uncharacterized membrane protein
MAERWEHFLERWVGGGFIDPAAAERIRAFEGQHQRVAGLRWPVLVAIALGALLLGAGVLLFVAAHWDTLSPGQRFGLVLALVALFHLAAALAADRFPALASALQAVGTICLGAGIFLAGQIFNLQEHWPGGLMLWATGAWLAWVLLRDWPQAGLAALLTPAWLAGEWVDATGRFGGGDKILAEGLLLLAFTYLTASVGRESATRRTLMWIGAITLLPLAIFLIFSSGGYAGAEHALPSSERAIGWTLAMALPLLLAAWLRGRAAWMNVAAAAWVVALGEVSLTGYGLYGRGSGAYLARELAMYGLCALGSIGLIAWGMAEARKERVNLGVAGFALTVLAFYFSAVMDKLGRSASLVGLGLLFLLGGWQLERTRRLLVARLGGPK